MGNDWKKKFENKSRAARRKFQNVKSNEVSFSRLNQKGLRELELRSDDRIADIETEIQYDLIIDCVKKSYSETSMTASVFFSKVFIETGRVESINVNTTDFKSEYYINISNDKFLAEKFKTTVYKIRKMIAEVKSRVFRLPSV